MAPQRTAIRPSAARTQPGGWALAGFLLVLSLAGPATAADLEPCEASAQPERAARWRAQVESDPLHRHAVAAFGPPTGCRVRIEGDPEGLRFGTIVILFPGGARYAVDSSPPESGRMSLRVDGGLPDPARARAALADQAKKIGLEIDWEHPIREADAVRYRDPDTARNASAELRSEGGKLVEVILRLAL